MNKASSILEVNQVCHAYGEQKTLNNVSLTLSRGEIGCLLGPSGCGKTTLLRIIAGFERVKEGRVRIRGEEVSSLSRIVPPEQRRIGMVFHDYALFPHLDVRQNITFGLHGSQKKRSRARAAELLELVGLKDCGDSYPHQLSGGQQQRVALARALAPEPELLLLDEPFSNLDVILRERLTVEVRDIIQTLGITTLMVSHNQHEAFAFADKVGVLFNGVMEQWDSANQVYHRPSTRDVATFVGDGTLIRGRVIAEDQVDSGLGLLCGRLSPPCPIGSEVNLLIRPEDILHVEESPVSATIRHKSFRGPTILYRLELATGEQCLALVSSHHDHPLGSRIGIVPELDNLVLFPENSRQV